MVNTQGQHAGVAGASLSGARAQWGGQALSVARIVVGFLFACHGAQSFGAFGGKNGDGAAVPFGAWPSWWAGAIQLVCGILIALGLGTRIAALLSSGAMAYAYFTVHQPKALLPLENSGEPAALYCWIFLLIAFVGAGPWALDAVIRRRRQQAGQAARPDVSPAA